MKLFLLLFLAVFLFSCNSTTINIDLKPFDGNLAKAFYSKFNLKNDEIYLLDSNTPFTGTIEFKADSSIEKKMNIKEGIIDKIVSFTKNGKAFETVIIKNKEGILQNIPDSVGFEIGCKFFNLKNLAIINGNMSEQECDCTIKDKKENSSLKISTRIDKKTGIVISEQKGTTTSTGEVIGKARVYTKRLNNGLLLKVNLSEDFEPKYSISSIYQEAISIEKDGETVTLDISYSKDKDIFMYADIANYQDKHCRESDKLTNHDTYLFPDFVPDNSACVSDAINFVNLAFNKKFTREELKSRILSKVKNNLYLGKENDDIKFFFE